MRRSVARALVSLASAALLLPFGGPASAGTCAAAGAPPHLVPGQIFIYASGSFRCADAAPGMTVTVCIEERRTDLTGEELWSQVGCETATQGEPATSVDAEVAVNMMVYATWLRTTVTGANEAGDTVTFTTPPVFWFNCACYVG